MIARIKSYLSYIERYPLYSTLLVLKDYEDSEMYEECSLIMDALKNYKVKHEDKLPEEVNFPMHISDYWSKPYQDMMKRLDITVEEKLAKEKATLIKLNLPV